MSAAEEIFLALADVDANARDAVLTERCGSDPRLRADVEAMLERIDAPDEGFLDPAGLAALESGAADGPLEPGSALGGFLVLHAIGSGGMGVVYAAQQDRPRRTVAIKVLRRGFRHPEILKRFEREAEVLGRLQHPGIAQVFSFDPGGRRVPAHLVMELVSGPPITEYAQAHGLGLAARIRLMVAVCEAIQHAHDRGIVHRDLKPANVLVSDQGQPKVLDFGIARFTGPDMHSTLETAHGQLLGTLAYMSPEQLRGATDEVDARSDVYALGVMFYRLMAGRLPFDIPGVPLVEAAQRILHTDVVRLGALNPDLAGPVESVAGRAMSPDRERRYQSAAALAADLRTCLAGGSPLPMPGTESMPPRQAPRLLVAESADHRLVAVGLVTGTVVVLDATTGARLAAIPGAEPLRSLTFADDGRLALGRADGRVDLVDLAQTT